MSSAPLQPASQYSLDASVVFWTDVVIVCVAIVLFFLTLPHAMARLGPGGRWSEGHFLRSFPLRRYDSVSSHRHLIPHARADDSYPPTPAMGEKDGVARRPVHVKAWQARFPLAMGILRSSVPIAGGLRLGGVIVRALYFGLLLFAALYSSPIFKEPTRAGWVAASQIPVVYVLATRNNALSGAWGMACDKLNYLHRFAGRLLVLAGNVHAIGYIYQFMLEGSWNKTIARPHMTWGLVSLVLLDVLFLFSLASVRQKLHNLFFTTHCTAATLFLITVCLHKNAVVPYALAGAAVYGVDHALRVLKTRVVTATIRTIPELNTTQLVIPKINAGWRAGQYVRIRIISGGMGFNGWLESHPFTIACAGVGEGEGDDGAPHALMLMAKKSGRWTGRLYQIAGAARTLADTAKRVKVLVEGPYGGHGHTMPHSFFGALYIVGGSGISYGLAAVQEAIQHADAGTSALRVVQLVWSVQHPDCLTPLLPAFASMLAQAEAAHLKLAISVFYTRAVTRDHKFKDYVLPADLALEPGRPMMKLLVRDVVERTLRSIKDGEERRGVFVGTCGPASLGDVAKDAIGDLNSTGLSTLVGGVELHEEAFASG